MKTLLSFVIPCYRSEFTIESVINEIIDTVSGRKDKYDYEIICVNDCSPDNVLSVLIKIAAENYKIKVINFAKNMGKHAAVLAGYSYAQGKYVVTMDDDFQCPTYELWRLLKPVENDECDIASANYKKKKQSVWKNAGSKINMVMSQIMLGKPKGLRLENFNIKKNFVVKEMIKYDKPYPYIEGLTYRITDRISVVDMEERARGDNQATGFTLHKSLSLWLNGFTAFSVKPLRLSTVMGFILAFAGFVFGLVMVIRKIINPEIAAGYTSMLAVQLFIGGIIMIILGLIGEYIGRIYICLNNSPQYVIRDKININGITEREHDESDSCLVGEKEFGG